MKTWPDNRSAYSSCRRPVRWLFSLSLSVAFSVMVPIFGQAQSAATNSPPADGSQSVPVKQSPSKGVDLASLVQKAPNFEFSISADYFKAEGYVNMPLFFAERAAHPSFSSVVGIPVQGADYYGATLTFSYRESLYFDLSYKRGEHSGTFNPDPAVFGNSPKNRQKFSINDEWYQAFARYYIPGLKGKKLAIYVRGGFTYVRSDLEDNGPLNIKQYHLTDQIQDMVGSVGLGAGYALYHNSHLKLGLQLDGDVSYGARRQHDQEMLTGYAPAQTIIKNDLIGGSGRATVRFEYYLGKSKLFRLFADGGLQVNYTRVYYGLYGIGLRDELLWGPYVKVGLRYSF